MCSASGHGPRATGNVLSVRLSGTVVALGVVSFLTDLSSEMIFPLLPVFLTTVLAAGPRALGIIEGAAESVASVLKVASGYWTDSTRQRKPFVVAGYSLAGVARPLIGLAGSWPAVLALRVSDRIGKGVRTSPRDALIADVTPAELRGRAYGLFYGLAEPVEKAWVAGMAPAELRGRAFGWYHGVVGLAALPASAIFGVLWQALGAATAFLTGAALALVAALLLLRVPAAPPAHGVA